MMGLIKKKLAWLKKLFRKPTTNSNQPLREGVKEEALIKLTENKYKIYGKIYYCLNERAATRKFIKLTQKRIK